MVYHLGLNWEAICVLIREPKATLEYSHLKRLIDT